MIRNKMLFIISRVVQKIFEIYRYTINILIHRIHTRIREYVSYMKLDFYFKSLIVNFL